MAKPVPKGEASIHDGRTQGNTTFVNIVSDNVGGNQKDWPKTTINGWVQYHKKGDALHTTWNIEGLEPDSWYQLKLYSKGNNDIGELCAAPKTNILGPDGVYYWECGDWGSESFLVMDIVRADEYGHIGYGLDEARLLVGNYENMQFIITQNSSPWSSAWTWENPAETISTFKIVPASVDLCFKNEAGPDGIVLDDSATPNDDSADNWSCWPAENGDGEVTYARAGNGDDMTLTAVGLAADTWYFIEVTEKTSDCSWVGQTNDGNDAQYYFQTDASGNGTKTFNATLTDYTEINVKHADWANTGIGGWINPGGGWGYVLYAEGTIPNQCTYAP